MSANLTNVYGWIIILYIVNVGFEDPSTEVLLYQLRTRRQTGPPLCRFGNLHSQLNRIIVESRILCASANHLNKDNNQLLNRGMNYFDQIKIFWQQQRDLANSQPWMKRLLTGEMDVSHYLGFLLETYHNTGYNPQLQAYASMYILNNPRSIVKKFYQHAISEIGHDLLALSDLKNLGVPEEFVLNTKPLPMTTAFFASAVWGIQRKGPLYYLGYLFHLEFSPTDSGMKHVEMLKQKGIPDNAVTFLEEHATVDIGHNKLMELYVAELVKTPEDFEIIKEALTVCVDLHTKMLCSAFENGEKLFGQKFKESASF